MSRSNCVFELPIRFVCIGVWVLASGCGSDGPPIASVSGQVLLDGRPLPDAVVNFEPSGGRASSGWTDESGRFELQYSSTRKGALVGEHVVRISTYQPRVPAGPSGEMTEAKPERVPDRYTKNSELTATVVSGWRGNEFLFELEPMP